MFTTRRRILIPATLAIIVLVIASGYVVAWHDGLGEFTRISDINDGTIPVGTVVTVKGNITQVLGLPMLPNHLLITMRDNSGSLMFSWMGSAPSEYSIAVVRGTVSYSHDYLRNVTFFEAVWLFP